MDVSHGEHKFTFKIEPKPGGGFTAHYEHPPNPPVTLEGATREELQQQIRSHMADILGPQIAARLPASFFEALNKPGEHTHLTLRETFKFGTGLLGSEVQHTATTNTTFRATAPASAIPSPPTAPVITSSSTSSSDQDFGPIRRTGDGTNWMLLLRFIVAALVVIALLLFLKRS